MTVTSIKRHTDSKMRAAVVLLACAAATLAAVILVPRTQIAPVGLVQLLPSGQMASAIQLFSKARQTDSQMGKDVDLELEAESHRAALAKEKLLHDQRRLKAIMQRIRVSSKPRDLHDKLHLVQAQYAVDLKNGYTHQLNGEYRSEYWPRAYDGSGGFDFAADSRLSPHKAGDAIEDVLATQGKAQHLDEQEQWADRVIARKDAE